jgi:hypothetical protein
VADKAGTIDRIREGNNFELTPHLSPGLINLNIIRLFVLPKLMGFVMCLSYSKVS